MSRPMMSDDLPRLDSFDTVDGFPSVWNDTMRRLEVEASAVASLRGRVSRLEKSRDDLWFAVWLLSAALCVVAWGLLMVAVR